MTMVTCHECKKTLAQNEEYMPYVVGNDMYAKCVACYEKDAVLRNFQKTEVYSRVVGYIRPVQQWNKGKQEEYADRKEYVTEKENV
ncbi:MAG TPA: anaerobic ribonucleoside-triphosphate reductase [Patescibacteria group bacterium]|nr:anaerobic ribonucleoside-triphosphate reductase [Patescibacteria group bacterium]